MRELIDPLNEVCARKLTVIVNIPQWIARDRDLLSRRMEGVLNRVTQKAVLFEGSAVVQASRYCHRCGRQITHPASLTVGYGPDCSAKLGIFWPDGMLSESEIEAIRESIRIKTKVEIWLPRSKTEITVDRSERKPEQHTSTPTNIEDRKTEHQTSMQVTPSQDNRDERKTDQRTQVQVTPLQANTEEHKAGHSMPAQLIRVKFEVQGTRILVDCPFSLKDVCKTVPGYTWDGKIKRWTYPATSTAASGLAKAFDGIASIKDNGFLKLVKEEAKTNQAQATKSREDLPEIPKSKTKAWGHQKQAFWFVTELFGGLPEDAG